MDLFIANMIDIVIKEDKFFMFYNFEINIF